jgi:hypothetical protein
MRLWIGLVGGVFSVAVAAQSPIGGAPPNPWLVQTRSGCTNGLYRQPNGGGAAVVVLDCESALGVTVGVVCFGAPNLDCLKEPWWDKRFWQDSRWANDVTAFAWDPNGKCLYVSTSEIYGDGGLFALDLQNRRFTSVSPAGLSATKDFVGTLIDTLDPTGGLLQYHVRYLAPSDVKETIKAMTLKLPACGAK